MNQNLNKIENVISKSSLWEQFVKFLDFVVYQNTKHTIEITIGYVLLIFIILMATSFLLRWGRKLLTRNMPQEDKAKFVTVFSFARWLIYLVVILIVFNSIGINVTAVFAASAALLIGVGLALQTLFQDIISGVFILVDQSVHVGDIIELDGKVGRVEEIKLRTTRAVTIDNRVLVIPNHLYLTNSLFNWTQNGTTTRENVTVGVAYGSDVQLVKKLLLEAASSHPDVVVPTDTIVQFTDFGDSSLNFKVVFTLADSFNANMPKSDIRFEIDRLFRENNITIPFPQRDVHIFQSKS